MENSGAHKQSKNDNTILFYILGGVIITAIIIIGFILYKPNQVTTPITQQSTNSDTRNSQNNLQKNVATPEERKIVTLACSQQYYNTVVGIPGIYYLSTEGEAPSTVKNVTCTIKASVDDNIVVTEKITPELVESPTRNGVTFRCTTKGVKLTPNIPTKVTADIMDDLGNNVSCSRVFLLP